MATATSEEPMPVAKAPSPPAVTVCESAPTITSPGLASDSATLWWQTPSPTSEIDAGLFGKLAQEHMVVGERGVGAGGGVVEEQHRLVRIGQL